jgi:hypothetical protein
MTSRPCCSAGRNGSGGAGMTLAIAQSAAAGSIIAPIIEAETATKS